VSLVILSVCRQKVFVLNYEHLYEMRLPSVMNGSMFKLVCASVSLPQLSVKLYLTANSHSWRLGVDVPRATSVLP
jgi:hypothetical protein